MFEYFRKKIANDELLFLQENYSSHNTVMRGMTVLKMNCFFHMETQIDAAS